MSRKDYLAIGNAIAKGTPISLASPDFPYHAILELRCRVAQEVAKVFERDNPNFNRERFLRFVRWGIDTKK
jgi:hypothetical protein